MYSRSASLAQLQTQFLGVTRRHNGDQARVLPAGLVNNDKQWTLQRSANAALGVEQKHTYRDAEMREALVAER